MAIFSVKCPIVIHARKISQKTQAGNNFQRNSEGQRVIFLKKSNDPANQVSSYFYQKSVKQPWLKIRPTLTEMAKFLKPEMIQWVNPKCCHWSNEFFPIFLKLHFPQKCPGQVSIYCVDRFAVQLSDQGPSAYHILP